VDNNMTWPRFLSLQKYWEKFPPIGAVCATFVTKADSAPSPSVSSQEFGTMEQLAGELAGIPGFNVKA